MEKSKLKSNAIITPSKKSERLDFMDMIRGFAFFGVLLCNIPGILGVQDTNLEAYSAFDNVFQFIQQFFLQTKFYTLFSFMFGWGAAIQWRRAKAKGQKFAPYFSRRMVALLIFGLLHRYFIWSGDILTDYALMGLGLLGIIIFTDWLEKTLNTKTNLSENSSKKIINYFLILLAIIFFVQGLFVHIGLYPFKENLVSITSDLFSSFNQWERGAPDLLQETYLQMVGERLKSLPHLIPSLFYTSRATFHLFILGFLAGKNHFYSNHRQHYKTFRVIFWIGLVIGLPMNYMFAMSRLSPTMSFLGLSSKEMFYIGTRVGALAFSQMYISIFILLTHKKAGFGKAALKIFENKKHARNFVLFLGSFLLLNFYLLHKKIIVFGVYDWKKPVYQNLLGVLIAGLVYYLLTFSAFDKDKWQDRLSYFAPLGKMAFSVYLTHSIVFTFLSAHYGLSWYGELGPAAVFFIGVAYYLFLIMFCSFWLSRFRFGPLEWLWRCITYGQIQSIRIDTGSEKRQLSWFEKNISPLLNKIPTSIPLLFFSLIAIGVIISFVQWNRSIEARKVTIPFKVFAASQPIEDLISSNDENNDNTKYQNIGTQQIGEGLNYIERKELATMISNDQINSSIQNWNSTIYQGRAPGSEGAELFIDDLVNELQKIEILPFPNQSYIQEFNFTYPRTLSSSYFNLRFVDGSTKNYELYTDYNFLSGNYSDGGIASSEVIYLNQCDHDDFDNLDVMNKVILCKYEDPTNAARYALEHGAAAVLLVSINHPKPSDGLAFQSDWVPMGLPVIQVFGNLAQDLLDLTGLEPIDLDLYHTPQVLNVSASLEFAFDSTESNCIDDCVGKNIYAYIPGRQNSIEENTHVISVSYNGLGEDAKSVTHSISNVAFVLEMLRVWQAAGYVPSQNVLIAFTDANFGPGQNYGLYQLSNQTFIDKDQVESFLFIDGLGKDTTTICSDGTRFNSSLQKMVDENGWNFQTCNSILNNRIAAQDYSANLIAFIDQGTSYLSSNFANDQFDKISFEKLEGQSDALFQTIIENIELKVEVQSIVNQISKAAVNQDFSSYEKLIDSDNLFLVDWFNAANLQSQNKIIRALDISVEKVELIDDFLVADLHLYMQTAKDELSVGKETFESDSRIKFILINGFWKWQGPYLPYQFISEDESLVINSYTELPWDLEKVTQSFNTYIEKIEFDYDLPSYDNYVINITAGSDTDVLNPTILDYGPANVEKTIVAHANEIYFSGFEAESIQSIYRSLNSFDWVLSDKRLLQLISHIIFQDEFLPDDIYLNIQIELQTAFDVEYPWYRNVIENFNSAIYIQKDLSRIPDEYIPIGTYAYLKSIVGWDGIQRMVHDFSKECVPTYLCTDEDWDQYVKQELGLKENLQFVWKDLWQDRIADNDADLEDIFTLREKALKNHNLENYLKTINQNNQSFINENIVWYNSLHQYDYYDISYDYHIVDYVANGILVETNTIIKYVNDDGEKDQRADKEYFYFRFIDGNKLVADSLAFYQLESQHFIVQFQTGLYQEAKDALQYAEDIYPSVIETIGFSMPPKQTIRLYNDEKAILEFLPYEFGTEAYLYTEKEQSIRIFATEEDDFIFKHSLILQGISESILANAGLENQWLRKAASSYYSNQIDNGITEQLINTILFRVFSDFNQDRLVSISDYQDPIYEDDKYLQKSLRYEAFDMIQLFISQFGEEALKELVNASIEGDPVEAFFENQLSMTLQDFNEIWNRRLLLGNGTDQTLTIANSFDVENVLGLIEVLSDEKLAGRQAGSDGNKQAAVIISEKFSELGLVPIQGNNYYQTFDIQYFEQTSIPTSSISDLFTNEVVGELEYRNDFTYLKLNSAALTPIEGEIIYLQDKEYSSPAFEGKILVSFYREDTLEAEIKRANDSNAAALLLVSDKSKKEETYAKMPINYYWDETYQTPVFEITAAGYNKLLKYTNTTKLDLNNSSQALPTKMILHIETNISNPEVRTAQNIIGFIPGSDPLKKNEIYLLSAHYDFVGDDPDGLTYSGWNDNASGVATMLEILESWKENDYHPAASVLVVAWDAQELGQMGSQYYIEHPIYPLEDIAGMIQLDSVAYGDGYYVEAFGDWQENASILIGLSRGAEMMGIRLKINLNNDLKLWGLGNNLRLKDSQFQGVSDQLPFRDLGLNAILIDWLDASENNLPDMLLKEPVDKNLSSVGKITSYTLMMLLGD